MVRKASSQAWVDRYVRDELTMDEVAKFETELLGSPRLQQELETAISLRRILQAETVLPRRDPVTMVEEESTSGWPPGGSGWHTPAVAASLLLAVFSTFMFWKTGNDSRELQRRLDQLAQPRGAVLTVPVDIMRSAGAQTPAVIVQKPGGRAAILLDIELGQAALEFSELEFALTDESGNLLAGWLAKPGTNGRAQVVLNNEQLPAARVWLEIFTFGGQLIDRRLLEFLDQ